jgi:hypothetical protein
MILARRSMLLIVEIATMIASALAALSARVFHQYRPPLETWGARLFIIGLVIWGSAFAAI